jgi:hypothetical protein
VGEIVRLIGEDTLPALSGAGLGELEAAQVSSGDDFTTALAANAEKKRESEGQSNL